MWCSDRRRLLRALAAATAVAGCGFRPVHGGFGSGAALDRPIRVESPPGRTGYFYARALRRRLGAEGGQGESALALRTRLSFAERETSITVEDDVTRYDLLGAAAWRLMEPGRAEPVAEGVAEAVSAYNTLARPYAVRVAEDDAERRVAEELAARVFLEVAAALSRPARA